MKRELFCSNEIEKIINVDLDGDEAFAERITFLASAAVAVAKQSCPSLLIGEWCTVAEALNGHYVGYEATVESILDSVWASVCDSAPECDDKWSVSCEALANRLVKMQFSEQLAVFEVARKFWTTQHTDDTFAQIFTKLGAPGLL